jgi:hypothetical protein
MPSLNCFWGMVHGLWCCGLGGCGVQEPGQAGGVLCVACCAHLSFSVVTWLRLKGVHVERCRCCAADRAGTMLLGAARAQQSNARLQPPSIPLDASSRFSQDNGLYGYNIGPFPSNTSLSQSADANSCWDTMTSVVVVDTKPVVGTMHAVLRQDRGFMSRGAFDAHALRFGCCILHA